MISPKCSKEAEEMEYSLIDWVEVPTSKSYKYDKYREYQEALDKLIDCECRNR